MPDWYRDHSYSPEAATEAEYRDWAQDNGAHVDRDHPETRRNEDEVF